MYANLFYIIYLSWIGREGKGKEKKRKEKKRKERNISATVKK